MAKERVANELNRHLFPDITKIITDFFAPIYFALYDTKDELSEAEMFEFLEHVTDGIELKKMTKGLHSTLKTLRENVYEEICHFLSQTKNPQVKFALESVLEQQEDYYSRFNEELRENKTYWHSLVYSIYKRWARKIYHCLGDLAIERRFFRSIIIHLSFWGDKNNKAVFNEFMGDKLIDDYT